MQYLITIAECSDDGKAVGVVLARYVAKEVTATVNVPVTLHAPQDDSGAHLAQSEPEALTLEATLVKVDYTAAVRPIDGSR
jgi:hypothetical protein